MIEWNGRRVKLGRVFCFVFGGLLASHGAIAIYYEADKAAKHRSTRTELHNKYLTIELLKIDNNRLRSRVDQMKAAKVVVTKQRLIELELKNKALREELESLSKEHESCQNEFHNAPWTSVRAVKILPDSILDGRYFSHWPDCLSQPETSNSHELPDAYDYGQDVRSHVDGFNILHYQVAPSRPASSAEKESSD